MKDFGNFSPHAIVSGSQDTYFNINMCKSIDNGAVVGTNVIARSAAGLI